MSMDNKVGGAGGVSNTPHKKYKARATCIDYFTFRINHNYEKERHLFLNLLRILKIYQYETKFAKGRNNYENSMVLADGITLLYGGEYTITKDGEETTILEMKGSGCREFEDRYYSLGKDFGQKTKDEAIRQGWVRLFEECRSLGGCCTRIDLPTDDFSGSITVKELKEKLHSREYTTRMRHLDITKADNEENNLKEPDKLNGVHTIAENEATGFSATFGSRRTVQLCIYDKKAEQAKKGLNNNIRNWIRYEVRYYHKNAELELPLLIDALKKGDESKHIASCLAGIFELKETNSYNNTSRSKNKPWSKWIEFIGDAGKKGSFANEPRTMSIESNAAWLAIDASASLGKLVSCLDDMSYNEIVGAFLTRWFRKIDREHLQAINQYRRSKGKKPFTSPKQIAAYHMSRDDFPDSFNKELIDLVISVKTSNKDESKEEDNSA